MTFRFYFTYAMPLFAVKELKGIGRVRLWQGVQRQMHLVIRSCSGQRYHGTVSSNRTRDDA